MNYKKQILESEKIISDCHELVKKAFEHWQESKEHHEDWRIKCERFHRKCAEISFLDGVRDYKERLRNGNKEAIEYAICFIEVRPYFFRSGYIYKDLIRVLNSCELSPSQRRRYENIKTRYKEHLKKLTGS